MTRSTDVPTITESLSARIGADVIEVDDIVDSVAAFGDRYLRRLYTPGELEVFVPNSRTAAARLAARFAAKEAMIKVLRPIEAPPDWRTIEVTRHLGGWCSLQLSGEAADLSDRIGIFNLAVSLTHESGMAAAVVVALCTTDGASTRVPNLQPTHPNQPAVATRRREGDDMDEDIRRILTEHGRLPVAVDELDDDSDLYQAGLTSHASVNVMLALEDAFDIEFPQQMLRKKTFVSVAAIREALTALLTTSAI
jgi:phosphopantetheine--protein transferase-like protein